MLTTIKTARLLQGYPGSFRNSLRVGHLCYMGFLRNITNYARKNIFQTKYLLNIKTIDSEFLEWYNIL